MVTSPLHGQCLCGDVKFRIDGESSEPTACHCDQCRQWSGHHWASISVRQDDLVLEHGNESLAWFPERVAERGFCVICGSSLFYRRLDLGAERVAVAAGALAKPTGKVMRTHIFAAEKSDYYDLPEDADIYQGDDE